MSTINDINSKVEKILELIDWRGTKTQQFFPKQDLEYCRSNQTAENIKLLEQIKPDLIKEASCCSDCKMPPEKLAWFYFSSPAWTWQQFCGREGWVSYCDECDEQIDFFCVMMN